MDPKETWNVDDDIFTSFIWFAKKKKQNKTVWWEDFFLFLTQYNNSNDDDEWISFVCWFDDVKWWKRHHDDNGRDKNLFPHTHTHREMEWVKKDRYFFLHCRHVIHSIQCICCCCCCRKLCPEKKWSILMWIHCVYVCVYVCFVYVERIEKKSTFIHSECWLFKLIVFTCFDNNQKRKKILPYNKNSLFFSNFIKFIDLRRRRRSRVYRHHHHHVTDEKLIQIDESINEHNTQTMMTTTMTKFFFCFSTFKKNFTKGFPIVAIEDGIYIWENERERKWNQWKFDLIL